MTDPVVIVGAGPSGLAVAAALRERGVAFRLFDRTGEPGGAYREMHDGAALASPTAYNSLPGLPLRSASEYTTVPEYRDYLREYAARNSVAIERAQVARIERAPRGFRAHLGEGAAIEAVSAIEAGSAIGAGIAIEAGAAIDARAVVVGTGMWSFPHLPAPLAPGAEGLSVIHSRDWRGSAAHASERLLIVGAGMTAVEVAEECGAAGLRVVVAARRGLRLVPRRVLGHDVHDFLGPIEKLPTWLARGHCTRPRTLPPADLGFSDLRKRGLIDVRGALVRCEGKRCTFADGTSAEIDRIVACTGFRHATPFLPPEVARAEAGHVLAKRGESVSWPGLFVLGSPCAAGLASEFLRGIAKDALLVADRIASGRER